MHLRRVIICAVQAAAEGPGGSEGRRRQQGDGERGRLRRREKRMEKEITRRWTTRFAWKLVSVLAKSYYALSFFPSAPPLSLSLLWLSPLFRLLGRSPSPSSLLVLSALSLSLSLFHLQRRVDACVRTQARKVLLSPTLMQVQRRISNLVFLFLSHSRFRSPLSLSLLTRFSPPL